MGRIRTIKPELPQSESLGRCTRDARLTFVLLFTLADDSGRLRGNSRMLASLLFPYDDDAPKKISGWLDELVREHCIAVYSVDGNAYVEIRNWLQHQKIDKPTASKIPPFANAREDSPTTREDSLLDQGSRIKDQGEECIIVGDKPQKRKNFVPPTADEVAAYCKERKNNINPQTFIDYYEARDWKLKGGQKLHSWKAAIRTWETNNHNNANGKPPPPPRPIGVPEPVQFLPGRGPPKPKEESNHV